jgi:hypothetical protein
VSVADVPGWQPAASSASAPAIAKEMLRCMSLPSHTPA